jgi:subtilisin family serine protease
MTQRFLLKLRDGGTRGLAGFQPRFGAAEFNLKPLFTAPADATDSLAAAAETATWYLAAPADSEAFGVAQSELGGLGEWDAAHRFVERVLADRRADVLSFEPDIVQEWLPGGQLDAVPGQPLAAADRCANPEGADRRFTAGKDPAWHLGPDFTGLKEARELVGENGKLVTIAHLDTGFDPDHITLPKNLDRERQRNFWDEDKAEDARDPGTDGLLNNPGHGPGTLGILAGGILDDTILPASARTGDFLGGAPHARIIPMRIANSVVHFSTSTVAAALNAARKEKVDVVSMSMGGYPSDAWADAINRAYDAGVAVVCAAGNTFGNPPTSIVYPARFERVLAACGIMANDEPYDGLPPFFMRGCSGPLSKMDTALSAYTPNIPWARLGCSRVVDLNGAGTSSATPQIAAAAALWIAHHGLPHAGSWARVEAVRKALFESSRRLNGRKIDPSLGMGILNARKALDIPPAAV